MVIALTISTAGYEGEVIRAALPHALEKLADLGGDCARPDV